MIVRTPLRNDSRTAEIRHPFRRSDTSHIMDMHRKMQLILDWRYVNGMSIDKKEVIGSRVWVKAIACMRLLAVDALRYTSLGGTNGDYARGKTNGYQC